VTVATGCCLAAVKRLIAFKLLRYPQFLHQSINQSGYTCSNDHCITVILSFYHIVLFRIIVYHAYMFIVLILPPFAADV